MKEMHTILVPIRYPLTAQTMQTLVSAKHIANSYDDAELLIFHVNLFQYNENVKEAEIRQAVAPMLEDVAFSVSVQQGFLIEEVILEEVQQRDVDTVVIGEKQRPLWRRVLNIVLRSEPDIAPFLEKHTGPNIDVKTVN